MGNAIRERMKVDPQTRVHDSGVAAGIESGSDDRVKAGRKNHGPAVGMMDHLKTGSVVRSHGTPNGEDGGRPQDISCVGARRVTTSVKGVAIWTSAIASSVALGGEPACAQCRRRPGACLSPPTQVREKKLHRLVRHVGDESIDTVRR
jgi:hypothetical protein